MYAEDGDKGNPREIRYGLVSEGNPFTSFFNINDTTGMFCIISNSISVDLNSLIKTLVQMRRLSRQSTILDIIRLKSRLTVEGVPKYPTGHR